MASSSSSFRLVSIKYQQLAKWIVVPDHGIVVPDHGIVVPDYVPGSAKLTDDTPLVVSRLTSAILHGFFTIMDCLYTCSS